MPGQGDRVRGHRRRAVNRRSRRRSCNDANRPNAPTGSSRTVRVVSMHNYIYQYNCENSKGECGRSFLAQGRRFVAVGSLGLTGEEVHYITGLGVGPSTTGVDVPRDR